MSQFKQVEFTSWWGDGDGGDDPGTGVDGIDGIEGCDVVV